MTVQGIHTGVLNRDGSLSEERILPVAAVLDCPARIMTPEHYPTDDGPCECYNRAAVIMADWGYEWSETLGRWAS